MIATDCLTKWKEARTLKKDDTDELISFIEENILSRFGVPEKFITDNGIIFVGSNLFPFVENMESQWDNPQINTHKETNLQNL